MNIQNVIRNKFDLNWSTSFSYTGGSNFFEIQLPSLCFKKKEEFTPTLSTLKKQQWRSKWWKGKWCSAITNLKRWHFEANSHKWRKRIITFQKKELYVKWQIFYQKRNVREHNGHYHRSWQHHHSPGEQQP